MQVVVHRRQFAISREHNQLPGRWIRRALPHGYTLSHDPDLKVSEIDAALGGGLLLGEAHAWGTPLAAGRHVALQWPRLALDAGGLLAVFYRVDGTSVVVTSSPAIARDFFGAEGSTRVLPRSGMNWHPSPGSPLVRWRRLMADQQLDLATGQVEHVRKSLASDLDEAQAASRLGEALRATTLSTAAAHARVLLPLTAGLDSRTLFAAALSAGVKFEAFTQVFGKNSEHDARSAQQIAKRYGIKHTVVSPQPIEPSRARSLANHALDSVHDADITALFPAGMYGHVEGGDVMLRGGMFEIGRLDYHGRFFGLNFDRPDRLARAILRRFREPIDGPLRPLIEDWVRYRSQHGIDLSLGDTFFFDQDIGSWLSAVEQGLDSIAGISQHPANSLEALRCLMSTTSTRRRAGFIQRRMIAEVDPALDRFEYNPVRQLRQRLRGSSLETFLYRLRAIFSIHAA